MDDQRGSVMERQEQELAPTAHVGESLAHQMVSHVAAQQVAHYDRPVHLDGYDGDAHDARSQELADHLQVR
jgi:hypothetical protein